MKSKIFLIFFAVVFLNELVFAQAIGVYPTEIGFGKIEQEETRMIIVFNPTDHAMTYKIEHESNVKISPEIYKRFSVEPNQKQVFHITPNPDKQGKYDGKLRVGIVNGDQTGFGVSALISVGYSYEYEKNQTSSIQSLESSPVVDKQDNKKKPDIFIGIIIVIITSGIVWVFWENKEN